MDRHWASVLMSAFRRSFSVRAIVQPSGHSRTVIRSFVRLFIHSFVRSLIARVCWCFACDLVSHASIQRLVVLSRIVLRSFVHSWPFVRSFSALRVGQSCQHSALNRVLFRIVVRSFIHDRSSVHSVLSELVSYALSIPRSGHLCLVCQLDQHACGRPISVTHI